MLLRNIGWDGAISRAAAAVSLAVLDARARAARVPVSRLLGAPATPEPRAVVVIGYRPAHVPLGSVGPVLAGTAPGEDLPGGPAAEMPCASIHC